MRSARVALMFFKAILGPAFGSKYHDPVSGILCQNGGRHYLVHGGIAPYYGLAGYVDIRTFVAVDKQDLRCQSFGVKLLFNKKICPFHGKKRCIEDVDLVDFGRSAPGDCPGEGLFLDNRFGGKTSFFGESLGVCKDFEWEIRWQGNGCGTHGSGKRSAARFIGTYNEVVDRFFEQ